jgi:tetratricopeptide (TPR) repeat protein
MIALAADGGGVGHTGELNALKQQIEALPKPAQGDKKKARGANELGLQAFNAAQYEQAKQYFLSAYQTNPADVEIACNLGFTYIKLGDLPQAVKALSSALILSPGRSSAWANLAEYYALQSQQRESVACYALAFHFSQNQNKTREYLQKQAASADAPQVRQAAQQALQLSLIQGSGATVAAAPTGNSLDAPLPAVPASPPAAPATPTAQSLIPP